MIIWRGWGFLAFLYACAAFVMVMRVTDALVPGGNLPFLFGSGLLLAAVATWFTGLVLNQSGPRRKLAAAGSSKITHLLQARWRVNPTERFGEHARSGSLCRSRAREVPRK